MIKLKGFAHTGLRVGILGVFSIVAIWYSLVIPSGEGVDEVHHFEYVRYIKEHLALPVQPMSREQGVQIWMGHHPPLYYAIGAVAIMWVDTSDSAQAFRPNPHFVWRENSERNGWNVMLHFGQDKFPGQDSILALYLLRLMTVGLGIITLYAIYRATELLLPKHTWAPLGATAVIGFNPSFLFMSSTVHHDTLLAAICALTMWWAIRLWNKPERSYDGLIGGLLLSGAVLTKPIGLILAPVVVWSFIIKAIRNGNWSRMFHHILVASGVFALVAGWWFIRNQILYGDPLGRRMFLNIYTHMARSESYTWHTFVDEFLAQLGRTYWGSFGYMHITFPEISKYFWRLVGVAGLGLVFGLVHNLSTVKTHWLKWSIPVINLVLLLIFLVLLSVQHRGSGQGRYLFSAGFGIGVFLIAGLNGFFNWRYQRIISIIVTLGMVIYAVWLPARFVLPKYAPPATASSEQLSQAQSMNVQLTKGVELVGYWVKDDRVFPGQWLPVSLYWRATGEPDHRQDPQVRLELIDEQGSAVASSTVWPVPSMSPDVWSYDVIYVAQTSLGLPRGELPGKLLLTIVPLQELEVEQAPASERVYLGEIMTTGGLSQVDPQDVPLTRQEIFASAVKLLGVQVSSHSMKPGDNLTINLYWQVLEKPPIDYTVFIHVLNDQDELVTQFDRPAGGNVTPTSTWRVGQTLRDTYPLSIPENIVAGNYTIRMGMYIWPSMERLSIYVENKIVEGSSIDLCTIHIDP